MKDVIASKFSKKKIISIIFCIAILVFTYILINIRELVSVYNSEKIAKENIKDMQIVLGGEAVGIKLLATGVLVMGIDRQDTSLQVGDIILSVNQKKVESNRQIVDIIKDLDSESIVELEFSRNDEIYNAKLPLQKDGVTGENKLGLWVKDSSAGVGTMTFYDKNTYKFASLGHGVTETKQNFILPITSGGITKTFIYSIKKGEVKEAGELKGTLSNTILADIALNTQNGIYGYLTEEGKSFVDKKDTIDILTKSNIKEGDAYIYCTLDDNNVEKYEVKIEKVLLTSESNKNMIIKITDERLINKTGGIIQGMSGSPIVQDGKLVGAITHVFLNDPTRGYGVFIENMIENMSMVK